MVSKNLRFPATWVPRICQLPVPVAAHPYMHALTLSPRCLHHGRRGPLLPYWPPQPTSPLPSAEICAAAYEIFKLLF